MLQKLCIVVGVELLLSGQSVMLERFLPSFRQRSPNGSWQVEVGWAGLGWAASTPESLFRGQLNYDRVILPI
jgi:hypothetical protein